jgi:hypothetical protein
MPVSGNKQKYAKKPTYKCVNVLADNSNNQKNKKQVFTGVETTTLSAIPANVIPTVGRELLQATNLNN